MTEINPLVVDLSHWDPADDYDAIGEDGIAGVIYKATEGQDFTDDTYVYRQRAAKDAGLMWGSYHFANGSDVDESGTPGSAVNRLPSCPTTLSAGLHRPMPRSSRLASSRRASPCLSGCRPTAPTGCTRSSVTAFA